MARLRRCCPVGIPQHAIQRGNNRRVCFTCDEDRAAYAHWLFEASTRYGVLIHAWVFMTNHIHLLATPTIEGGLSRLFQYIGRHYVRYFNRTYQQSGTLWEGRFKSCVVQEESYLLICHRYIELNPVRAKMVNDPAEYVWSSYQVNALGVASKLCSPHDLYLALGNSKQERLANYKSLFESRVDGDLLTEVRRALNTGLVLGTEKFRSEVEAISGQRLRHLKPGPKPTKKRQTENENIELLL